MATTRFEIWIYSMDDQQASSKTLHWSAVGPDAQTEGEAMTEFMRCTSAMQGNDTGIFGAHFQRIELLKGERVLVVAYRQDGQVFVEPR